MIVKIIISEPMMTPRELCEAGIYTIWQYLEIRAIFPSNAGWGMSVKDWEGPIKYFRYYEEEKDPITPVEYG